MRFLDENDDRAWKAAMIAEQLDLATRQHLDATVEYNAAANAVRVPRVFLWFRGDFGGRAGIHAFLRSYDAIPESATPSIRYRSWDWSKAAGAYAE